MPSIHITLTSSHATPQIDHLAMRLSHLQPTNFSRRLPLLRDMVELEFLLIFVRLLISKRIKKAESR